MTFPTFAALVLALSLIPRNAVATQCSSSSAIQMKSMASSFVSQIVHRYRIRANEHWPQPKPLSHYMLNRFHYKCEVLLAKIRSDIHAVSLNGSSGDCIGANAILRIIRPKVSKFIEELRALASESLVKYKVAFMDESMDPIWDEVENWFYKDHILVFLLAKAKQPPVEITESEIAEEKLENLWNVPTIRIEQDYGYKSGFREENRAETRSGVSRDREDGENVSESTSPGPRAARASSCKPIEVDRPCDERVIRRMMKHVARARSHVIGMSANAAQLATDEDKLRSGTQQKCWRSMSRTFNRILEDIKNAHEANSREEINREMAAAHANGQQKIASIFSSIVGTIEFEYQKAYQDLVQQFDPPTLLNASVKGEIQRQLTQAKKELQAAFGQWKTLIAKHEKARSLISHEEWAIAVASERRASTISAKWYTKLANTYGHHRIFLRILLPNAITFNPRHMLQDAEKGLQHFLRQFPHDHIDEPEIYRVLAKQHVPISVSFQFIDSLFRRLNHLGLEHTLESQGGINLDRVNGHKIHANILSGFRDEQEKPYAVQLNGVNSDEFFGPLISDEEAMRPLNEETFDA